MPNLNALDNIGDITEEELDKLLQVVVNKALSDYEKRLRTDDIKIRTLYLNESREIVLKGMIASTKLGLKKAYIIPSIEAVNDYYLNATFYESKLSNRLYRDAQRAQRTAVAVVEQHVKARTTWQRLAKDLRRKTVTVDDLPQYLLDVQDAFKKYGTTSKTFQATLKKAERQIAKFTNKNGITRSNLVRAYSDVVKAATTGDQRLFNKKMTVAIDKKAIANSQRLSRSELSRAYNESEIRRMLDDSDLIGKRHVLSPSHPRPDECNFHAEVDLYGMGVGVSPVGQGTPLGIHSRCICMFEDVLRKDGDRVGRFSKERGKEYLDSVSENKRESMLGKKSANDTNNWQSNLKGYRGEQDLTALPSELVVKK